MIKSRLVVIFAIIILTWAISNITFAENVISLNSDMSIVEKGQTFSINVKFEADNISALAVKLLFNDNKVEYISGPDNSNLVGNQIIYSWFDDKGGINPLKNGEFVNFTFKAKEAGQAEFGVSGEMFDVEGNSIESNYIGTNVDIQEEIKPVEKSNSDSNDANAYLKVLRIREEGLEPTFNKDITDYYFIAGMSINNIDVIAVPQSSEASVKVIGNDNLKDGMNKISIEVISKNRENKKIYNIYVSKVENIESANANLENLAFENVSLNPEFESSQTEYRVDVPYEIETLKILAVPENRNANVQITGNENLKIGNNKVVVNVTAENGFTIKYYRINVHRRNQEEQHQVEEEQEVEAEKLSAILENVENNENSIDENNDEEQNQEDTTTEYDRKDYVRFNFSIYIYYR